MLLISRNWIFEMINLNEQEKLITNGALRIKFSALDISALGI
jgi:hypothetical protein